MKTLNVNLIDLLTASKCPLTTLPRMFPQVA